MAANHNSNTSIELRPELANMLETLAQMPTSDIPALLAQLELVRTTAMLRLSGPAPISQEHDERIDVETAVERLGMSTTYLYRHAETFPFTRREGRRLLFSSRGIDQYISRKR